MYRREGASAAVGSAVEAGAFEGNAGVLGFPPPLKGTAVVVGILGLSFFLPLEACSGAGVTGDDTDLGGPEIALLVDFAYNAAATGVDALRGVDVASSK